MHRALRRGPGRSSTPSPHSYPFASFPSTSGARGRPGPLPRSPRSSQQRLCCRLPDPGCHCTPGPASHPGPSGGAARGVTRGCCHTAGAASPGVLLPPAWRAAACPAGQPWLLTSCALPSVSALALAWKMKFVRARGRWRSGLFRATENWSVRDQGFSSSHGHPRGWLHITSGDHTGKICVFLVNVFSSSCAQLFSFSLAVYPTIRTGTLSSTFWVDSIQSLCKS